MNIKLNQNFEKIFTANINNSAKFIGSGDLEVLATPSLVAFFEIAANEYLKNFLTNGNGSVGSNININHLAPSKIGSTIIVKGIIENVIDEKAVIFKLEAFDDNKKIATASHTRYIINEEKFMNRLLGK